MMASRRSVIAAMLALVLAAAFLYFRFVGAGIDVSTEPAGASVWLDGRRIGRSPVVGHEVDTGVHLLRVEHTYFAPEEMQFSIGPGRHERFTFELAPGRATLDLQSNPRDAWVEVDGERLSTRTPTRYSVDSGPHEVVMGDDERRSVARAVTVKAGETLRLTLELNPDPHGSLTVLGVPAGGRVEVEDLDVDYMPGVRIPIGEHLIRISAPGYRTQEMRVMVKAGGNSPRASLMRLYGTLMVSTQPADALVSVQIGDSAMRRLNVEELRDGARLPAGTVDVQVRKSGFRSVSRRVAVKEGRSHVRVTLEPMHAEVGREFRDRLSSGGTGPLLVVVPPGEVFMGGTDHRVLLTQPFAVAKYEVTVGEYLRFAAATDRRTDRGIDAGQPDIPVTRVTVRDADAYARWLSAETGAVYRLPSEAEWEYAAKGGAEGRFPFGDAGDICAFANVADGSTRELYRLWRVEPCSDGFPRMAPVGRLAANGFGLHDMFGNAAEWVAECEQPSLHQLPDDGRSLQYSPSCLRHVHRGGTWDTLAEEANAHARASAASESDDRGIRLIREL